MALNVQTSYSNTMGVNYAGLLASAMDDYIESAQADVAIGFGLGVSTGATAATAYMPSSVKLVSGSSDVFRGFAVHFNNENGYYAIGDTVGYLRRGQIWVPCATALAADVAAKYIVVSGATQGYLTGTSGSNLDVSSYVRVLTTLTAAGIALVEVNLP